MKKVFMILMVMVLSFGLLFNVADARMSLNDKQYSSILQDDDGTWYRNTAKRAYNEAEDVEDVRVIALPSADNGYIQLIDTTLDDDPTSYTSAAVSIGDCKKVSFMTYYNETEVGETLSCTFSFQVSPDSSTWSAVHVIDNSGTDAPVTSKGMTADSYYHCSLPIEYTNQYMRVVATGVDTDADDTIAIDTWLLYQK